jgi:hypothetical protein
MIMHKLTYHVNRPHDDAKLYNLHDETTKVFHSAFLHLLLVEFDGLQPCFTCLGSERELCRCER